jgi:hypothetical protein
VALQSITRTRGDGALIKICGGCVQQEDQWSVVDAGLAVYRHCTSRGMTGGSIKVGSSGIRIEI